MFHYWIAPDQHYSVIRAEREGVHPKGSRIGDSIQCKLKQYEAGGVWFPETVVYQRRVDGELRMEEVTTVKEAEFNIDLNPNVFTLAGMDVPAGTSVLETPSHSDGTRMWDGSKLVPKGGGPLEPPEPPSSARWLAISVSLAVAAAVLFVVYWRRRGAEAQ